MTRDKSEGGRFCAGCGEDPEDCICGEDNDEDFDPNELASPDQGTGEGANDLDVYGDDATKLRGGGDTETVYVPVDGDLVPVVRKKKQRSQRWKGKVKIEGCDDDKVKFYGVRPRSGIADYSVLGTSVSWRGLGNGPEREFLCLHPEHRCNDCPHTRRLKRYRDEHPEHVAEITPA